MTETQNSLAQRPTFSLVPTTYEEAMKFATALSKSKLVPAAYQGKPEDIFVAVQYGAEIGLKPLQALQSIAVINGKPGIYGDAGKALLRANGFDIEETDIEDSAKTHIARCTITHPRQKPVTRSFSMDDAKRAGLWQKAGPWTQHPYRQMAWRAFWFAARDAAADVLKGLQGREELEDYVEIESGQPGMVVQMPQRRSTATLTPAPTVETSTVEAIPVPVADASPAPVPVPVESIQASVEREPGEDDMDDADVTDSATAGVLLRQAYIKKTGKTGPNPWTLYIIETEGGQEYGTFDKKLFDIAESAIASGAHVTLTSEPNPKGGTKVTSIALV